MKSSKSLYHRHRFPREIIRHTVWLYYRFCLSYRDVEDLLAERGVNVSYETVRRIEKSCRAPPMTRLNTRIIERRFHMSRLGSENGKCGASSLFAMLNCSYPYTARCKTSSGSPAIYSKQNTTECFEPRRLAYTGR